MHSGDFEIIVIDGGFEEEPEEAEAEARAARGRKPQRDVEIEAEEADARAASKRTKSEDEGEDAEAVATANADAEATTASAAAAAAAVAASAAAKAKTRAKPKHEPKAKRRSPQPQREERGGRNGNRRRRRGRGRGRRVYEVDGGEWLDFVSADLKHLTPRPERPARNGDARRAQPAVGGSGRRRPAPEAEIIVHPAAEPVTEPPAKRSAPSPRAEPRRSRRRAARLRARPGTARQILLAAVALVEEERDELLRRKALFPPQTGASNRSGAGGRESRSGHGRVLPRLGAGAGGAVACVERARA